MNIAIIPARNGSKSIINKNLQKIGTKSLVEMTVESARHAGIFSHIILSTDIPILIEDHQKSDITIRERPKELCTDQSMMSDVVLDCIKHYGMLDTDNIWLLQPTSPFRVKADYRNINRMMEKDCDSVISVVDVSANHPNRMYKIKDGNLFALKKQTDFLNKQDLKEIFIRSGHYYTFKCGSFRRLKKFYLTPCKAYVIEKLRAINIDDHVDLRIAKILAQEGIYQ